MGIPEEHEKLFMRHAVILGIEWDEFKRLVENAINGVVNLWEKLKESVKELTKVFFIENDDDFFEEKPSWHRSYKPLKSQVLNRKPMQARARSYC
jgi:hypothetical protein